MVFNKRIIFGLIFFIFIACSNKEQTIVPILETRTIRIENKYKTEVKVHYSTYDRVRYIFYTDNEVDVCSFNGTNYLIEKNNKEELFSTTAPIEIIKQTKFDQNGTETECETSYYRRSD